MNPMEIQLPLRMPNFMNLMEEEMQTPSNNNNLPLLLLPL